MTINADSPDWPYQQVAAELRRRIASGSLGPRLPSTQALAIELAVSPMTVQKALGVLVDEGIIYTRPGRGRYVTEQG